MATERPILDLPDLPTRHALTVKLVAAVDGFVARSGMSETQVRVRAGVPKEFFARLRRGEGFNYDTAHQLTAWLRCHWDNPSEASCAA